MKCFLARMLACALMVLGLVEPIRAQMEYKEPVLLNEHEVSAFHRIFETTAAQREAAAELLRVGRERILAGEAEAGRIIDEYRKLPKEVRTLEARRAVLERSEAARVNLDTLRGELLEDLRSLLTQEQLDRWKRFEYFRTRERVLYAESGLLRDRTNLLAIVAAIGVSESQFQSMEELLATYERELDALLHELERIDGEVQAAGSRGEDATKALASYVQASRRLAQHNFHYARRIGELLPEELRAKLNELYDCASLNEAYRPNPLDAAMRAAPDVEGLGGAKREEVVKTIREYSAKYDGLTRRIAEMESAVSRRNPADEMMDTTDWDAVRTERARVVAETHHAVTTMLTQEQYHVIYEVGQRAEREWREKMTR